MSDLAELRIHQDPMPRNGKPTGFGALVVRNDRAEIASRLPVRALDVEARIEGLVSRVTVRTTYRNVFDDALRAVYIFPLPADAAVTAFFLRQDGRTIQGKVMERGEAIRAHEHAIRRGKTSALFEEDASETFTLEVGNIPPRAEVETELTFLAPVVLDQGRAWWRLPLVVGEKYIPGAPLPGDPVGDGVSADTDMVPDGSRLNPPRLLPGMPNPVALGVRIDVDAGPLASIATLRTTIPLRATSAGEGMLRLELASDSADPDRDLILRWDLAKGEALEGDLRVARGSDGQRAFTATLLAPSTEAEAPPRDVVVLLDRSGSMGGWKMPSARKIAARLVDGLRPVDRFLVAGFDDRVEMPAPWSDGWRLVAAGEAEKRAAHEFLLGLEARGGTELGSVLERSLQVLDAEAGAEGREAAILLVTDAQVGDERRILAMHASVGRQVPVYGIGVDAALNAGLLGQLATRSGGYSTQVARPREEGDALDTVTRLRGRPRATEIEVEAIGGGALERATLAPSSIEAMHGDVPVTIAGWFRGKKNVTGLRVRGHYVGGKPFSIDLEPRPGDAALIVPLWAKQRIRDLERRFDVAGGRERKIEREIVETSTRHQVLSRFTAFLAIDEKSEIKGGDGRTIVQPVMHAMGHLAEDAVLCCAREMRSAPPMIASLADKTGDIDRELSELRSDLSSDQGSPRRPVRELEKVLRRLSRAPKDATLVLQWLRNVRDALRRALKLLDRIAQPLEELEKSMPETFDELMTDGWKQHLAAMHAELLAMTARLDDLLAEVEGLRDELKRRARAARSSSVERGSQPEPEPEI